MTDAIAVLTDTAPPPVNRVATLELNKSTGKWQIWLNGALIKEAKIKYYLTNLVNTGGLRASGVDSFIERKPGAAAPSAAQVQRMQGNDSAATNMMQQFSVDERFTFAREIVAAVGRGHQPSAIITGEPGLGKSHVVREGLEVAGLIDINKLVGDPEEVEQMTSMELPENAFAVYKGHVTPQGLYSLLYKFNGRTLVFDDCDKVLTDTGSEMILKGALDSEKERLISWKSGRGGDVPPQFIYTGTCVFVSNMTMDQLDDAFRSRTVCVDLCMNEEQKLERMWKIARSPDFMFHVTNRRLIIDCMGEVERLARLGMVSSLNMRTVIKAVNMASSNAVSDWKRTVAYFAQN